MSHIKSNILACDGLILQKGFLSEKFLRLRFEGLIFREGLIIGIYGSLNYYAKVIRQHDSSSIPSQIRV